MPILWQVDTIVWANAKASEKLLTVENGYEGKPQNVHTFKSSLEQEVSNLPTFLH